MMRKRLGAFSQLILVWSFFGVSPLAGNKDVRPPLLRRPKCQQFLRLISPTLRQLRQIPTPRPCTLPSRARYRLPNLLVFRRRHQATSQHRASRLVSRQALLQKSQPPDADLLARDVVIKRVRMARDELVETEGWLTQADRLWRAEMRRTFGPDGVLLHGFSSAGQGEPGSQMRRMYEVHEVRQQAITAWRQARRF